MIATWLLSVLAPIAQARVDPRWDRWLARARFSCNCRRVARGTRLRLSRDTTPSTADESAATSCARAFLTAASSSEVADVDALIASLLGKPGAVTGLQNASRSTRCRVKSLRDCRCPRPSPTRCSQIASESVALEAVRQRLTPALRSHRLLRRGRRPCVPRARDFVVGALFQNRRFDRTDSLYVWGSLADRRSDGLVDARALVPSTYTRCATRRRRWYAIVRVCPDHGPRYLFAIRAAALGLAPSGARRP